MSAPVASIIASVIKFARLDSVVLTTSLAPSSLTGVFPITSEVIFSFSTLVFSITSVTAVSGAMLLCSAVGVFISSAFLDITFPSFILRVTVPILFKYSPV